MRGKGEEPVLVGALVLCFAIGGAAELSCEDPAATELLRELYVQLIPFPGTQTTYGIPISLWNVKRFISWYNSITLAPQEAALLRQALAELPVPPCGHASILTYCRGEERELEKVCGAERVGARQVAHPREALLGRRGEIRGGPVAPLRRAVHAQLGVIK